MPELAAGLRLRALDLRTAGRVGEGIYLCVAGKWLGSGCDVAVTTRDGPTGELAMAGSRYCNT